VVVEASRERDVELVAACREAALGTRIVALSGGGALHRYGLTRAGADVVLERGVRVADVVAAVTESRSGLGTRHVIAVFAGKGGVGVTTLVANIAVGLARFHGRAVVAADCRMPYGNLACLLGVELLASNGEAGAALRVACSTGVTYVAPGDGEAALESVPGEGIIVADCGCPGDGNRAIAEWARHVILVTDGLRSSIPPTRRALDLLASVASRVSVVVNRVSRHPGLSVEEVGRVLGRQVATALPYEPDVVGAAAEQGVPFVMRSKAGAAGKVAALTSFEALDADALAEGRRRSAAEITGYSADRSW
jgi:MinD-like ATPase involved in chromosome partitioning or flagellar assembly